MRCLKMLVESPFSDKSSARSILTRASGLGILTFDKIKKIAQTHKIRKIETKMANKPVILSKPNTTKKNDIKKFFMEFLHASI